MASKKLFYYLEKRLLPSKINPMWKTYLKKSHNAIDSNESVASQYLLLQKSIAKYRKSEVDREAMKNIVEDLKRRKDEYLTHRYRQR
ncbi:unnamed protein product [Blepharisma stoltei]|uniref:Uncharacterized protein n=1 Tax=Blepharisma stoltei TaxID=1481888 RepID=A0AAU9K5G0_9CILI|nr:unnamed protein product [Blepharisma stoltei]